MSGALAEGFARLAVESGSTPTESLLAMIPGPIGAFLAVLLVLMPIVSEVKGWTHGPLAKRVEKAAEKAEAKDDERDIRWANRDRRVEELEYTIGKMQTRMTGMEDEISLLHRIGDAQNRLLSAHTNWDREAQSEINARGGNLRPPPPLYVILSEDGDGDTIAP